MKEIQFTNKVWISQKGKLLDRALNICCWIYLIFELVVILMEGIRISSMFTCIAAIVIIIWTRLHIKNNGHYVETECKITFLKDKIIWEYPSINMPIYKGQSYIKYNIDAEKIKNVSISNEIKSLRLECSPLVEYIDERKQKTIDYRKKNKSCVLIVYNYDLEIIMSLFEEYINVKIDIID